MFSFHTSMPPFRSGRADVSRKGKKKKVYEKQEQTFKISIKFLSWWLANCLLHTVQAGPAPAAQGYTLMSFETIKDSTASAGSLSLSSTALVHGQLADPACVLQHTHILSPRVCTDFQQKSRGQNRQKRKKILFAHYCFGIAWVMVALEQPLSITCAARFSHFSLKTERLLFFQVR